MGQTQERLLGFGIMVWSAMLGLVTPAPAPAAGGPVVVYGVYDPDGQVKVPRNKVPPTVIVGDVLTRPSDRRLMKVIEVTADTNHPLAGKALIFDVKILKIEQAAGKP